MLSWLSGGQSLQELIASKKWDKATPGASVIYASGKSGTQLQHIAQSMDLGDV